MGIRVGDRLPDLQLPVATESVSTKDLFAGKKLRSRRPVRSTTCRASSRRPRRSVRRASSASRSRGRFLTQETSHGTSREAV